MAFNVPPTLLAVFGSIIAFHAAGRTVPLGATAAEPSMWSELKTQRPVMLGLLAWLVTMACACVLLQPTGASDDWVSLSVSNGASEAASPLSDTDESTPDPR